MFFMLFLFRYAPRTKQSCLWKILSLSLAKNATGWSDRWADGAHFCHQLYITTCRIYLNYALSDSGFPYYYYYFVLFCSCLQLTEDWGEALFSALRKAGGRAFSNMAVGYNNVDVNAATKYGVAVGNTPVSFISWYSCQIQILFTYTNIISGIVVIL